MAAKNVYEELADMLVTDPTGALEMKIPEFMQHLRLQYTPREARLAVQLGLVGGKLDELSEKTGIEKGKLKEILHTMANKGTMWIDPGKEDPIYRAVGLAGPGISETAFWAGVKNADTVTMAKLWNKWKYLWVRYGMGKLGFPLAPVWAAEAALPDDALPSENVVELIKENDHWSISSCPCRFGHWVDDPGHHCRHLLETCLHMGDISRWCVEHGMAREITCDEAIEIMRKANEDGLVTTCYPNAVICNCCRDCCPFFIGINEMGLKLLQRSNFVSQINEETCSACKTCAGRCPVGAIEVDEFAVVDGELCIGCGICVPTCKTESVRLVRRPEEQ
jgi:Pyruvate/2-oxoacid:ferredoxin oxidoreductase delta subunit